MKNFTTLMKESFEIYKVKIKPILVLIAISIITTIIFGLSFVFLIGLWVLANKGGTPVPFIELIKSPFFFSSIGIILLTMVCFMFVGFSFLICVIKPAGTKLKEIFQEAWKKLWQYFWIMVLVGFFTILFSIFLIIPGIIVGIYLSFCSYVFIVEKEQGMNALKRSWALVKGNWWKVFGRVVLLNIVFGIIFSILGSVNDLLGSVFQLLSMPFGIIFLYLIYFELKKSKEIQVPTPIQV